MELKKLAILCGLSAACGDAWADESIGWYVVPKVGAAITDSRRNVSDAESYGMGFGTFFTPNWGLEFEGLADEHHGSDGSDLRMSLFAFNLLRAFNSNGVVSPFVSAGIGVLDLNPDIGESRDDLVGQLGVGISIRLWQSARRSDWFSLRPEAKVRWDDARGTPVDWWVGLGFEIYIKVTAS
jgi:hypothetical protein